MTAWSSDNIVILCSAHVEQLHLLQHLVHKHKTDMTLDQLYLAALLLLMLSKNASSQHPIQSLSGSGLRFELCCNAEAQKELQLWCPPLFSCAAVSLSLL